MSNKAGPAHPLTTYEDFSGISTAEFKNPYDALIAASNDDIVGDFTKFYSDLAYTMSRNSCSNVTPHIERRGMHNKRRRF